MINISTRIKPCFKAEFFINVQFSRRFHTEEIIERSTLKRREVQFYGVKTGPKYLSGLQKIIPV